MSEDILKAMQDLETNVSFGGGSGTGGSWQSVFERTQARVRAYEAAQGVPPAEHSNPQASIGRNMRGFWAGEP